ncbi:MAG: hypothetical protein U0939_19020 [Pirellulales bacterium]
MSLCLALRPTSLRCLLAVACLATFWSSNATSVWAGPLLAGAAKVDVTNRDQGPAADTLYVKALVLKEGATTFALITVDAVAIGEIGPIGNDYLNKMRQALQAKHGIAPERVLVNASHCHGIVRRDLDVLTVQAVEEALQQLTPVKIGVGKGREDRISENRRLKLKDGSTTDVRHAYSVSSDEEIAEIGPIDPEIGILRLDRLDGRPLAVVYHFACHPIQGVPGGKNTADLTGYASQTIEDAIGGGCIALFVQGCGGDINPVLYKDVDHPRHAQLHGTLLGASTLKAWRGIQVQDDSRLAVLHEQLELPRADTAQRIATLEAEQQRLLQSLRGTSLNFKTFLPLAVKYAASPEFPSYYSHRYLLDEQQGRDDWKQLDAENRRNMAAYLANIRTMEQLTRIQTNLALLRKHQLRNLEAPKRMLDVEMVGWRAGDFVMVSFPGELTVRIGLNLKQASPHPNTFIAGYSNGYIYYAPTADQLENPGAAQEDADSLLAPAWQEIFERKALEMLKRL